MKAVTPFDLVHKRLNGLLSQLSYGNLDLIATQVAFWVTTNACRLQEHVQLIYAAALEADTLASRDLAHICRVIHERILQIEGGDMSRFLTQLSNKRLQELAEVGIVLGRRGDEWMYQLGSMPPFVALTRFIGS